MAGEQGRLQYFARLLALGVAYHTDIGLHCGFAGLTNDSGISALAHYVVNSGMNSYDLHTI
jgi:hypothetical protein